MILLKNVSFCYSQGEQDSSLKNINLSIREGELVLLCGESGCGKTTLTRLINGLIPHYYEGKLTGDVFIDEKEINKLPIYETARLVASVFQNPRSQFFNVDTTSELAFGGENMGIPVSEIERRMLSTVHEFNIENLMERNIFKLSGGEKQKIACASANVCDAPILVLDEPSSNLDTETIDKLRQMVEIWKRKGKTIIIAEHRLYYLRELADRIIFMKNGCIECEFTASQLKEFPAEKLSEMGLRTLSLESIKRNYKEHTKAHENLRLCNFYHCYKRAMTPSLTIDNIDIPRGGIIAVIGLNGAGKSTFARCLCGLEKRCKGTLYMSGEALRTKKRLKQCYMVMQDVNHQLFTESVFDEVLLSMDEQDEARAEEILKSLDLLSLKDLHPMSLSGGQKQRVAIAGAIASQREIIIFDEPTSGLDLRHMHEVSELLKQLCDTGKTLFIISHDMELLFWSCTHVLHFESGRVIESYPFDKEGSKRLRNFFLSSAEHAKSSSF